jgi:hypothetical protein
MPVMVGLDPTISETSAFYGAGVLCREELLSRHAILGSALRFARE